MIYENISLNTVFAGLTTQATLTCYARSNSDEIEPDRRRASVLICPGGGYWFTSDREAEPVALAFVAKGYHAFVLRYSTQNSTQARFPTQLQEVSAALAYIRRNADRYHVKSDAIAVCGFSAGGHLAASLGVFWNDATVRDTLQLQEGENRPDALILSYPVITSGPYTNAPTIENLLGETPSQELLDKVSLEKWVTKDTPPAFIWHTLTDGGVPCENSLLFAAALKRENVPFELHIFPDGIHGLSLGTRESRNPEINCENPHIAVWLDLCTAWLGRYVDHEA